MEPTNLEIVIAVAAGLGLSAAVGFRVFLPLLALGLAARFELLVLGESFAWVSSTPALIALGTATVAEIAAYYIPWVDNALDTIASPVSLLVGTVIFAAVMPEMDSGLKWVMAAIAGGGTAGTVQTGSVLLRAASSVTTGGIGNPFVSTLETGSALLAILLALFLPILAGILAIFLLLWLLRKILIRRRTRAKTPTIDQL